MRHKNTLIKKEILILIGLIIILNVIVVLGQTDNQISSTIPAISEWDLQSNYQITNNIKQILRGGISQGGTNVIDNFRTQFNTLENDERMRIWNGLTVEKDYNLQNRFLKEIIFKDEESTKKFLEALDSSSSINDEYKFLSSVIKNDDELIKQTFNAFDLEPNKREERYARLWGSFYNQAKNEIDVESRNKIARLLNKEQFQTLIKTITKKTIELPADFDEKAFGYEVKDGNQVWTLKKEDKTYFIPEKNLPDNLEKIVFKQITEGNKKGQYGVFYKTVETFTGGGVKGNTVVLPESYYLQKSDNPKEWIAKNIDTEKGEIIIGLDPKAGQVEIASDGKIEMWGTGHLTGKDGVYVKIGEQKFFPHPEDAQTQDKLYRYAFVTPLEKDVFNVKGNMIAKVDGKSIGLNIYGTDNGVVSLKQGYAPKENENLIALSPGGLDIKGTALNGKVSFSVSEDMKLTTSKGTFDIKPKDGGGNYYSYNPIVPTAKGELVRFVESGKGLEYVPRTRENTGTISGTTRVGTGQTADGKTPAHVGSGVQNAVAEATKISTEEGNWATATETEITETGKTNEEVSTNGEKEKSTTDLKNEGEVIIGGVGEKGTTTTDVEGAGLEQKSLTEQTQLPSLYQSTLVQGIKKYVDGSYSYYANEKDKSTLQVQVFNRENLDKQDTEVYVALSTSWCGPCQALKSNVQSNYQKYPDKTFIYIDAEKQPDLAAKYGGASSYPTVRRFKNGERIGEGWGVFGR